MGSYSLLVKCITVMESCASNMPWYRYRERERSVGAVQESSMCVTEGYLMVNTYRTYVPGVVD